MGRILSLTLLTILIQLVFKVCAIPTTNPEDMNATLPNKCPHEHEVWSRFAAKGEECIVPVGSKCDESKTRCPRKSSCVNDVCTCLPNTFKYEDGLSCEENDNSALPSLVPEQKKPSSSNSKSPSSSSSGSSTTNAPSSANETSRNKRGRSARVGLLLLQALFICMLIMCSTIFLDFFIHDVLWD